MNQDIRVNWEWFHTDPQEFRKIGDRILVYGRWRARGRDSGVELDVAATWVVEVRDGTGCGRRGRARMRFARERARPRPADPRGAGGRERPVFHRRAREAEGRA